MNSTRVRIPVRSVAEVPCLQIVWRFWFDHKILNAEHALNTNSLTYEAGIRIIAFACF